jgi:hypothetical protein
MLQGENANPSDCLVNDVIASGSAGVAKADFVRVTSDITCREVAAMAMTYYRCRRDFGGLQTD